MSTELAKEVLFFIEDPYEVTGKVRELVEDGQRVIQIQRYESPIFGESTLIRLHTLPANRHVPGEMVIPNQDGPHAIFESVEPKR